MFSVDDERKLYLYEETGGFTSKQLSSIDGVPKTYFPDVIIPHGADRDPDFIKALGRAHTIDEVIEIIDNWRNV